MVLSLPGFFGSDPQHKVLDSQLDWVTAALDLLDGLGVSEADMVSASIGAMVMADVAAICPNLVRRQVLVAPYGLYEREDPVRDVFALPPGVRDSIQCSEPVMYQQMVTAPEDADGIVKADWEALVYRSSEAAARIVWPFGDKGLKKRLHRIKAPTLLLWGSDDAVVPQSYAKRFADGISGPSKTVIIDGAGHQAVLDKPQHAATEVLKFLDSGNTVLDGRTDNV